MLKDLCKVRRMGVAAAATVSIAGSVLLIYNLVTPQSVRMMRTADLVALVAMLLLPALAMLTMRRAARARNAATTAPPTPLAAAPRSNTHEPGTDCAARAEGRRRRAAAGTRM